MTGFKKKVCFRNNFSETVTTKVTSLLNAANPMFRLKVRSSEAEEKIKIIRILALSGSRNFHRFLLEPIRESNWGGITIFLESAEELFEKIERLERNVTYMHTIPTICKKLIQKNLDGNHSQFGEACILFLEKIQKFGLIAISDEALEFLEIIRESLNRFYSIYSDELLVRLERILQNTNPQVIESLVSLIESIDIDEKTKEDADRQYKLLLSESKKYDIQKCKKLIAAYLVRYAEYPGIPITEIGEMIRLFREREERFAEELEEFCAIQIYYQLLRGIISGNLKKVFMNLRKYRCFFTSGTVNPYEDKIYRLETIFSNTIDKLQAEED